APCPGQLEIPRRRFHQLDISCSLPFGCSAALNFESTLGVRRIAQAVRNNSSVRLDSSSRDFTLEFFNPPQCLDSQSCRGLSNLDLTHSLNLRYSAVQCHDQLAKFANDPYGLRFCSDIVDHWRPSLSGWFASYSNSATVCVGARHTSSSTAGGPRNASSQNAP